MQYRICHFSSHRIKVCFIRFTACILDNLLLTETSKPDLKDLYELITPQYAADWKVIGTPLGIPSGELKAIETGWPATVKCCYNQMLEKWLEVDPTASWGKLFIAIESPAVSSDPATDQGGYIMIAIVALLS